MSALFIQYPSDTLQTGTDKVDPARKFKCTTAARVLPPIVLYNLFGFIRSYLTLYVHINTNY